jgi:hypothetical protein
MGKESGNENQQKISYEGSGDSVQDPIIIKGALSHRLGVVAEYIFIQHKYGRKEVDWKVKMQMLLKGDRPIDLIKIELADGTIRDIYFDTSDFWGKAEICLA